MFELDGVSVLKHNIIKKKNKYKKKRGNLCSN